VSTPIADVRFLRGIFAALVFATGMCVVGVIYTLLAVPSPPAGIVISSLP
jgi:xanthosine utilization system XapX-like protein